MKEKVLFIIALILLSGIGSASFYVGNGSAIIKDYNGGEVIKGTLNMSFSSQNVNSLFSSTLDGKVKLLDALNTSGLVRGIDYTCEPLDCGTRYRATSPFGDLSKQVDLAQKRFLGLKIVGRGAGFGSTTNNIIDFNLSSSTSPGCKNQFYIDFFDDGKIDFYNRKYLNENCGEPITGCFSNTGTGYVDLTDGLLCEKVILPPAPAFKVGANIKIEGEGNLNLGLFLYNLNGGFLCGDAEKSSIGFSPQSEIASNIIPCGVTNTTEAFICARSYAPAAGSAGSRVFKIKFESDSNSCGGRWLSNHISMNGNDYDLFAQPLKYDTIDSIKFSEIFRDINGFELKTAVDSYINKSYNRNCSDGCIIPFSVWRGDLNVSGANQRVNFFGAQLRYDTNAGTVSDNNLFYSLVPMDFLVNSPYKLINIEKMGFNTPDVNGSRNFAIFFDGSKVLEEAINVRVGFRFDISPKFSLIGRETVFSANNVVNGTSSTWNFGDNSQIINSPTLTANHMYLEEGIYDIRVEVTNTKGETSARRFKVAVGDPKASLGVLINNYLGKVSDLKADLNQFPEWMKTHISKTVGLSGNEENISAIKTRYNSLTSEANESEYVNLINRLLVIQLPDRIYATDRVTALPGELGFDRMDPSLAAAIGEERISDSNAAKNAILGWFNENYRFDLSSETISARVSGEEGSFLRRYKVAVHARKQVEENSYLIIGYPASSIVFNPADDFRSINNFSGSYKKIEGSESVYEFIIYGRAPPKVEELGIYISPAISDLRIQELGPILSENKAFPWKFFLMMMVILLFFIFVIYVLLYWWYKNNYEKHLFKNPGDLYNLINFIYNSRRAGLRDDMIKDKLKINKWKGEQIIYAFNKIDGKRTGMFEIPIFKFIENKKVRKEIQRRQGAPPDARFIKRPF